MLYKITRHITALLLTALLATGCGKYLDKQTDKKLVILSSIDDLQALLDYYTRINNQDEGTQEISADNYYLTDAIFSNLSNEADRNMYLWQDRNVFTSPANDWSRLYDVVFIANTVLENADQVSHGSQSAYDNARGQAYYHRARSFLNALGIWGQVFDSATADNRPGIPLRLSSDFNQPTTRATVRAGYDQVIADLRQAIALLPGTQVTALRPNKAAAYGLLARAYLYTGDYAHCLLYADSALQLNSYLLDYNTRSATASYPIPRFNGEVLMDCYMPVGQPLQSARSKVDTLLYASYDANDLRKSLFFKANSDNSYYFRGSYIGSTYLFHGLATDEVYLIRAECYARAGLAQPAMDDFNALLAKRWKAGTFTNRTAASPTAALALILTERRKELLYRGLRWMDIKRLNREGAGISLHRIIGWQTYTLPAGSPRFAMPIPEDIISLSGIAQNTY